MKFIFKCLYMDLKRSFGTIGFLLAVVGVCVVYYSGAWNEIGFSQDILYLYKYSSEVSGFSTLITLFCVLPYTTGFCDDWNSQYIRPLFIRIGATRYGISKVIACALSSGTAVALGLILFIVSLMPWVTFVSKSAGNYEFFATNTLGGVFLLNGQNGMYFAIYIYLAFLAASFWSVFGLCASAYIPNKYVALCTPFIASYILNFVTNRFPVWARLNKIIDGSCIIGGTLLSIFYATLLFSFLTIGVGAIFVKKAKRRIANV